MSREDHESSVKVELCGIYENKNIFFGLSVLMVFSNILTELE